MQKEEFLNKLFSISPDLFPSEFPTGLKEFVLSTIFIVASIAMRNVIPEKKKGKKMSTEKIKIDISECEYYSNHGRSYYIVKCPYCGQSNTCYVWSVSANGKRCEDCKSLITLKAGEFTVTKKDTKSKKTLKSEM